MSTINPHVALARTSLQSYIADGKKLKVPKDAPRKLTERAAGVFVTLYKDGDLRGCIGTISPATPSIAEEIIQNAISASTEDPRFPSVSVDELDKLEVSVDVLEEPEDIQSMDQLDVEHYGVIVSSDWKRGLLLPNLEGVNTPKEQVHIALQKAGIRPDEPYNLQRFKVVRHV